MLSIPQIREATQLWLEPTTGLDIPDALARLNAGNNARDDMLAGLITVDDYLDVLSDLGLDLDAFCDGVEHDLGVMNAENSSP